MEGGKDPFTVYNSSLKDTIILRIPPVLALMSENKPVTAKTAALAKSKGQTGSGSWHYTISSHTADFQLNDVIVGYGDVERKYAVAPSFGNESVTLVSDNGKETMGHFLSPDLSGGGRVFKLRFANGEKRRTAFSFTAKASGQTPSGMQAVFINAATGERIDRSISVDGKSHEDVLMVVGMKQYLEKVGAGPNMKFAMGNILVNQAARSARIKYYIPFAGIERVEVTVFDLRGNRVWRNSQKAQAASWNTMEWNSRKSRRGSTAAGLYIVRVKAINAKGKVAAVADRKLTFAP
jgi:hypothetical protein